MQFSLSIMQALPVEEFQVAKLSQPEKVFTAKLYHWRGTYTEFLAFYTAARKDNSPAGRELLAAEPQWFGSTWSGNPETADQFCASHIFPSAVDAFEKSLAKFKTSLLPGALNPATAGGAWIVPLVLANNPMPARIRARTKLPPKNLSVLVSMAGFVEWQAITESTARLAMAAWEYIKAGGAVRLTYRSVSGFAMMDPSSRGPRGLVVSIEIPLTSKSELASACSAQIDRGPGSALAQALSEQGRRDSLQAWILQEANALALTGDEEVDAKARATLGVE